MVLTRDELITSLKEEIRLLLHLIGKLEPSMVGFRPTPKQRSAMELLQYLAVMAPVQIAVFKTGVFTRAVLSAAWTGPSEEAAQFSLGQCSAAIQKQSDDFDRLFNSWTDADFREEVNLFGNTKPRGYFLVNVVLSGLAAYRMQLFCYLKLCGRDELNTANLWYGADNFRPPG
jgi:hypothetical protein